MRGFSKCVCGHDKMKAKPNKTINDPFGVGALIFKARWKIFERQESPEGWRDLVGFKSVVKNLVIGYCCWHSDIGTPLSLCVAK